MSVAMTISLLLLLLYFNTLPCSENILKEGPIVLEPYFANLTTWAKISASSTCGQNNPEVFCLITGGGYNLGHNCSVCDAKLVELSHPVEYAFDGSNRWWKSENFKHKVDISVSFRQEFFIAYVMLVMGPSPPPATWVLEKSTDYGKSYTPLQFFAKNAQDCERWFRLKPSVEPLSQTDVICTIQNSKMQPQEYGEAYVILLRERPGAGNFHSDVVLQNWTRATNLRLRFLQLHTLYGELMPGGLEDDTLKRHYFYSLREIHIGGRCICNGHAKECIGTSGRLVCNCLHNTCGSSCSSCCPGFHQVPWRPATINSNNACQACNCFEHAANCVYNETVAKLKFSLNMAGVHQGGGVCLNCMNNTMGINCADCKPGFFRKNRSNLFEKCTECDCDLKGSRSFICATKGGQCPCLPKVQGRRCTSCQEGFWGFPYCKLCDCHDVGSFDWRCDKESGQCPCRPKVAGRRCDFCPTVTRSIFSREGCIECDQCSPLLEQEIKTTLEDEVSKELMQMKFFTASTAYNVALDNVYSRFQMLNNEMIVMSRPSNPMGSTKRIRNFSTLKPYEVEFLRIQLNQLFFDEFGNFHVRQMASKALKSNIASFKQLIRFQLVKEEIHNMYSTIISATNLLDILGEFPQGKLNLAFAIDESEVLIDNCRSSSLKLNKTLLTAIRESETADKLLQVGKRYSMNRLNLYQYHTILLSFKLVLADINDWTRIVKQFCTNTTKLNIQNRLTLTKIREKLGTIMDGHLLSLSSKVLVNDGRLLVGQLSQDKFSEIKVYFGRLKRGIDSFIASLEEQVISFSKNVKPYAEYLNITSLEARRKWELELSRHGRFRELLENMSNVSSDTLAAKIIASSSRQLLRKAKQFENVKAVNLSRHLYNLANWPKGNPTSVISPISNGVVENSPTTPKTDFDGEFIGSGCELDDEDQCIFIRDEIDNNVVELKNSFPNETKNPTNSYKKLFGIIGDEESSEFIGVQSDLWFDDGKGSKTGKEHALLPEFYFADETLQTVAKGFAAASTHFRKKSEQVLVFLGSKWKKFDQVVANVDRIEKYYSKALEETRAIAQNALSDQTKPDIISNANFQCEQAMDISSRAVRHALSMTANYRKAASREVIQSIRSKLAVNHAENSTIGVENGVKRLMTTVHSLNIHGINDMFKSLDLKKTILKQKLDEALKIASLFKGAVRVITPGFILVPISSEAKSSASVFLEINLSVKPNLKNAFIFQFGESSKEETLKLSLQDGHFILETEFLRNVTKVMHPLIVSEDWFHVNVKKIGDRVSLSISTDCLSPTSVETSFAASVPQQMFFMNKHMYIFGLPQEMNKEELGYFNGCMDDVFVNGQEVSLFSPIRSSGKRGVCIIPDESVFCEGKRKLKPMTLQGQRDGMHFTAKLLLQNSSSKFTFELDFRTIYSNTFIAQMVTADESSWIRLSLFRGSVLVEFVEMESVRNFSSHNSYYNDGKWHNVKLFYIHGGFYQLLVDNQDRKSEVTLHWILPVHNADIYLGQMKSLNITRKLKWNRTVPFVGCLAHFNLEPSTELIMKDKHVAVHGACQESLWNCVCFEDLSRAIVISESLTLELQSIRLTFKMLNFKGTIVSYSTTVYSNVTVGLDGDSLQVVVRSGKFSKVGLLSLPEAVNDGAWHVFSLLPSRQSLTVTLDDVTLLMDRGLDAPVYKKQHHLIIGMRSLDQRFSLVELRGCLKELAVNNK